MNQLTKLTLIATAMILCCSASSFAQKFGYISSQELIMSMPERDSAQVRLEKYSKELQDQLETIQVEFNTKLQDYQKNAPNLSDAVKQLKEKELGDLQNRFEEFQEVAQRDMQEMQAKLMAPVIKKANEAISKVGKENALAMVFDTAQGALVYFDEAQLTNILPMVKKELGIVDKPAPAATAKPAPARR